MHAGRQKAWPRSGSGIGLSTGDVAAALLGSEERLEYTLVGDTVNLSQRLQDLADGGETVLSEPTFQALSVPVDTVSLGSQLVKGRDTPVVAYKIARQAGQRAASLKRSGTIPHPGPPRACGAAPPRTSPC